MKRRSWITIGFSPRPSFGRGLEVVLAAAALFVLSIDAPVTRAAPAVDAELDERPKEARGALVRIQLPITTASAAPIVDRIRHVANELLDPSARDGERPILLLELLPSSSSKHGEGSDFYAAQQIVDLLMSPELNGVKKTAYVARTIKGHGVLIATACEEIVMSNDAEIGDAGVDEPDGKPIRPIVRTGYEQVARARRTIPEAMAIGMLDRSAKVWKVETEAGTEFVLEDEKKALAEHREILSEVELVPAGALGNFSASEARRLGFAKFLVTERADVADALHLPETALIEDQSILGDPRPVMLQINGAIDAKVVRRIATMIGEEKKRGSRWIGITINSEGGELEACLTLANTLASQNPNEVRTVAFIPVRASGGAALVALACDQLVMQPDARLGGGVLEVAGPEETRATIASLQAIAADTNHDWSVFAAMIDPDVEIYKYRHKETGRVRLLAPEEANKDPNWVEQEGPFTVAGKPWELGADQAKTLGVAWQTAQGVDGLSALFGFESPPQVVEPNWAFELIEALASPGFASLLIAIGFFGLYIELQAPGIGIGGFVASVAFLLFFWSNFLNNTAEWLEVLLFLGGVCFILLEIFVLPGFGVFGLGGGLMVIASLILASQTFVLPHSSKEVDTFRRSISIVAAAGAGVVLAAMLLRRYLPNAPMFSRILLNPPDEVERESIGYREAVVDYTHLIGERGVATTSLRPAGKGDIAGELVDVIAEDDPIDRGEAIEVVHAQGNRVVVRPVSGETRNA